MTAQAVQGLAAALAGVGSCSPSFLLCTARERGWVGEGRREREEETNPKEGFGFSLPPVYVAEIQMIEVSLLLEFPP